MSKQYVARITIDGKVSFMRTTAKSLDDAIRAFKATIAEDVILVQVKGGHQQGDLYMPDDSGLLNWTRKGNTL